nr:hypothetical protein [Actinoplanes ferrugineus]
MALIEAETALAELERLLDRPPQPRRPGGPAVRRSGGPAVRTSLAKVSGWPGGT